MIQISEEKLSKARELRGKQQQIQMDLGAFYVSEQELKTRQAQLVEELKTSNVEIQDLMNELAEEYGHGTLSLETGEFTVSEQITE